MIQFSKLALAFATFACIGHSAFAAFQMEPYLGTSLSSSYDDSTAPPTTGDISRNNFGIRLGYQSPLGWLVGGDLQLATGSFESGNNDVNVAGADFGPYVGFQSGIGLRGYASYFLASSLIADQGIDVTYSGNGYKLGVGYSFMNMGVSWLAVNLEYLAQSYDEAEFNGFNRTANLDTSAVMLMVSFPLHFN